MKRPRRSSQRDYTKMVAECSGNRALRDAYQSGKLLISGDSHPRKFWIEKCPPELWDDAETAAKDVLGFDPII